MHTAAGVKRFYGQDIFFCNVMSNKFASSE